MKHDRYYNTNCAENPYILNVDVSYYQILDQSIPLRGIVLFEYAQTRRCGGT
jgi:hypothetical protein